jgi:hypothetical protein
MLLNGYASAAEKSHGGHMPGTHVDANDSTLEKALAELIQDAVRTEVQELVRLIRDEDRLLTIDQVAERWFSRDWVCRNGKRLSFTRNSDQNSSRKPRKLEWPRMTFRRPLGKLDLCNKPGRYPPT